VAAQKPTATLHQARRSDTCLRVAKAQADQERVAAERLSASQASEASAIWTQEGQLFGDDKKARPPPTKRMKIETNVMQQKVIKNP